MQTSDGFLVRNIRELRHQWKLCSGGGRREALLVYLDKVYEFYRDLRKRAKYKRKKLKRYAKRIASLNGFELRDDMHTLRCIIEASSSATPKEKNRMTQALRYAFAQHWRKDIVTKLRENGSIAGCAAKFGKTNRRGRYSWINKKAKSRKMSVLASLEAKDQARSVGSSLSGN